MGQVRRTSMTELRIGGKTIGPDYPTFIVAEISGNHLHDFDNAVKLVKVAKEAGADAVKLQTYTPDSLTIDCDNDYFRIRHGEFVQYSTFYELYAQAYTPWDWQPTLQAIAEEEGLVCFSSPFDREAVDFLESMDVPAYKIASFEITDIPLIEYIASKGKPVLISTGIASWEDMEEAVATCRKVGNHQIVLLKCTSAYPAPYEEMNLRAIDRLSQLDVIAGLSDHTLGIEVPIAAVALGARVIEKHITLDRALGGPDASFSLEPLEFKAMVNAVRNVEAALGSGTLELSDRMLQKRKVARSLFVVQDLKHGDVLTEANVRSIRPGYGLHPRHLKDVLGRRIRRDVRVALH